MPYGNMYFNAPLSHQGFNAGVAKRHVQFRLISGSEKFAVLSVIALEDDLVIANTDYIDACFTWNFVSPNPNY